MAADRRKTQKPPNPEGLEGLDCDASVSVFDAPLMICLNCGVVGVGLQVLFLGTVELFQVLLVPVGLFILFLYSCPVVLPVKVLIGLVCNVTITHVGTVSDRCDKRKS